MKLVAAGIQGLLVIGFLWWGLTYLDWKAVLETASQVSLPVLLLVFVQRYLPYCMLGIRLKTLFPQKVFFSNGFQSSILCVGCNNILPARMGELIKVIWLRNDTGLSYQKLFCGVLLERLLDVSMLLILIALFGFGYINSFYLTVLSAVICLGWLVLWYAAKHKSLLQRVAQKCLLPTILKNFVENCCIIFEQRMGLRALLLPVGMTFLVWAMNYLHVELLANHLMGLGLSWQAVGLLCVSLFFGGALLLVPGGIGVMEASVFAVLVLLGIDSTRAATTALWARLFYSVPALAGSVVVLLCARTPIATSISNLQTGLHALRFSKKGPETCDSSHQQKDVDAVMTWQNMASDPPCRNDQKGPHQ